MPEDLTKLVETFKLQAGITMPFETAFVAVMDGAVRIREGMSQENRDRQDGQLLDLSGAFVKRIIRAMDELDKLAGIGGTS